MLFSFPDQVTALIFLNNLRVILSAVPKIFENIEARQSIRYSY